MSTQPTIERPCQAGFSLVEALIALLVLSVGLLGLAALQLSGMQSTHSAYQRTIASVMATDAAERIWIKVGQLDEGEALTQPHIQGVRDEWLEQWGTGSVEGDPGISAVSLPDITGSDIRCEGNECEIIVQWAEGRFEEDDGAPFMYRMNLPVSIASGESS